MSNSRGISSIIATLILILLTIVLIGIVWVVVSGIVSNSTKGATSGAQCFNSGVQITSASCTKNTGICNVTVQRTTGTDVINGVRLVFINAAQQSNITDVSGNIQTLGSASTTPGVNIGIANVTEVDAAIYFTDASGTKNVCNSPVQFTTVQLV